jgi:hypothetical protein
MTDLQRSQLLFQCAKAVKVIESEQQMESFFKELDPRYNATFKKDNDRKLIDVVIEIRHLGDQLLSNIQY